MTENIYTALAKAQAEMTPPAKNAENPAFKRDGKAMKYADLSAVVESIRAPLTKHGLSWGWRSEYHAQANVWVWTAFIAHGASNSEVACAVPVNAPTGNNHAFKSAVTYAKRIGIESVSGQAPGDDDDGNAAVEAQSAAPPARQAPPPARKPEPQVTPDAIANACEYLAGADDVDDLTAKWKALPANVRNAQEVVTFAADAKAKLQKAATPPADDLGGDSIPY